MADIIGGVWHAEPEPDQAAHYGARVQNQNRKR